MNTEPQNFTARERELEMLAASVAKTHAALRLARLTVLQLESKLVNKLAEHRFQTLSLERAQRRAARSEQSAS